MADDIDPRETGLDPPWRLDPHTWIKGVGWGAAIAVLQFSSDWVNSTSEPGIFILDGPPNFIPFHFPNETMEIVSTEVPLWGSLPLSIIPDDDETPGAGDPPAHTITLLDLGGKAAIPASPTFNPGDVKTDKAAFDFWRSNRTLWIDRGPDLDPDVFANVVFVGTLEYDVFMMFPLSKLKLRSGRDIVNLGIRVTYVDGGLGDAAPVHDVTVNAFIAKHMESVRVREEDAQLEIIQTDGTIWRNYDHIFNPDIPVPKDVVFGPIAKSTFVHRGVEPDVKTATISIDTKAKTITLPADWDSL